MGDPAAGTRDPLSHAGIDDMSLFLDHVLPEIEAATADLPVILFGHSVGAVVAFEVARRLEAVGRTTVMHVIVSGHAEPSVAHGARSMSHLPDDQLLAEVAALGLLREDMLDANGVAEVILPPIRADFALAEGYHPAPEVQIAAPLTALGGVDDPIVDATQLGAWATRTAARCKVHTIPGGHFFTQSARAEVLAIIAGIATDCYAARPKSIAIGAAENYPVDACLHTLFRRAASATPDAVAVVGMDRSFTFAELNAASDLLARALIARGCGIDRMVAILLETSVDFVVAYLAILKAGGAYLPIPMVTPDRAIADILDHVRPVCVISRSSGSQRLPLAWQGSARCIQLDAGWEAELAQRLLPSLASAETPGPDDLAYCVMTSGTTGAPKGIMCPHRGAVNSYWWRFVYLPYGDHEREACNVFFVWEVLRPLLQGRPAYVIPDDVIYDPRRLIIFLQEHAITRILLTPLAVRAGARGRGDDLTERLSAVRIVILNGEVVSLALAERARRLLPHVTVINDYSISECHDVTTSRIEGAEPQPGSRTLPAGHVMANVRVYILDDDLAPTPWGVPGGSYTLPGPTLARGYLNLPDETAARFLADPFQGSGQRMFRTGDIGRLLPDGQLEVHGRAKFMIKLRGYTVVPSAVEAVIARHPAVQAAVVTTVDDP
ncbi:MAG: alpha/beta fold hydrolase [Sphingomonadales bacterium]|nr:alpha/beta fold hydrolase [Sphingomonadales bacterium]